MEWSKCLGQAKRVDKNSSYFNHFKAFWFLLELKCWSALQQKLETGIMKYFFIYVLRCLSSHFCISKFRDKDEIIVASQRARSGGFWLPHDVTGSLDTEGVGWSLLALVQGVRGGCPNTPSGFYNCGSISKSRRFKYGVWIKDSMNNSSSMTNGLKLPCEDGCSGHSVLGGLIV